LRGEGAPTPFNPVRNIFFVILVAWLWCGGVGAETDGFYFVQISDTHWGARDGVSLTRRAVALINALPVRVECVVHTGDILADNVEKEAVVREGLAALDPLKVPIHFVPGNHDILASNPRKTSEAYQSAFGPVASVAEYRGVVFIFLFTEPLRSDYRLPGYDPMPWLTAQLKAAAGKPVLLFYHAPQVADFHHNQFYPGWSDKTRLKWEKLLTGGSVKAIITGHFHRDELHWVGDIPMYVGEPITRFWDRQPAFRLYEYRKGHLGYRTIYLDEERKSKGDDGGM
jgi:3',5'-cyclic AMP phosphodiesterase CpdA